MLPVGTNPPSVSAEPLSLSSKAPQPQNPNQPSLHDAGRDGLTQSTEGSLLFYGWVISHNAAALGVGAGEDNGFPQSKLQVVLTARGGEKQKEPGRKAARLLCNVQEELREEAKLHHRHGTSNGGVPKPGVRSFQADKPSRKSAVSVSIPPVGGSKEGGVEGVHQQSTAARSPALTPCSSLGTHCPRGSLWGWSISAPADHGSSGAGAG